MENNNLLNSLMGLDDSIKGKNEIVRAPFKYPGGKAKSVGKIIPLLDDRDGYCEPFGGSGAVLLARKPANLEIFNDRFAGVTCFYQCLRDERLMNQLCDKIELTIHSREEFTICRDTWENCNDPVERAFRWYYALYYSFGGLGRHWGRGRRANSVGRVAGVIKSRLKMFPMIHERLKHVQIENRGAIECIKEYDSPDMVFYLDPPYVDAYRGTYKHEMTIDEHKELIDVIFNCEGFVAVSGFSNPLYDNQDWDDMVTWERRTTIGAEGDIGDSFTSPDGYSRRGNVEEVLWIKE